MFLEFKKWVKSLQTAGYNGARTVLFSFGTLSPFMAGLGKKLSVLCRLHVALPKWPIDHFNLV